MSNKFNLPLVFTVLKNFFHQLCSHDMLLYQFDPHIYVIYQDTDFAIEWLVDLTKKEN